MLRLKSQWGIYILSNAVRVDVYTAKEEKNWAVYLSIDQYKQLLFCFESQVDAKIFSSEIREKLYNALSINPENLDLDVLCTAALQTVEKKD